MTDPHEACIAEAVRFFEEQCEGTLVEATEWPDHACAWFTHHLCRPHGRGVWCHPTTGQFLAWSVEHLLTDSQ